MDRTEGCGLKRRFRAEPATLSRQNGDVLILYPDTNALYGDLLMLKPNSQKLVAGLLEGHVEVALSPVVLAEARRLAGEEGERKAGELEAVTRGVERSYGVAVSSADLALSDLAANVRRVSSEALAPLLTNPACRLLSWPSVDSEELVTRELERRLPTKIKGDQSIGLRDTMIWHGLVELMEWVAPDDEVLFVTADAAFSVDGQLAESLVNELGQRLGSGLGVEESVRVLSRLELALIEVQRRRDTLTRQEGVVLQAVVEHIASFEDDLLSQLDQLGEPPLRFGVEEGFISYVDVITITGTEGTPPSSVQATADVTVSGSMRTDEYVQEYSEQVEWVGGELNDPMVSVEFTATILVDATVEVTDEGDDAWVTDVIVGWAD